MRVIITEEEAKNKRCPKTFGWVAIAIGEGVRSNELQAGPCIGSDCAVWVPSSSTIVSSNDTNTVDYVPRGCCGLITT